MSVEYWLVPWIVVARAYTGGTEDTRYLSINILRKARKNLRFDPPKLGDPPPTSDLIALW